MGEVCAERWISALVVAVVLALAAGTAVTAETITADDPDPGQATDEAPLRPDGTPRAGTDGAAAPGDDVEGGPRTPGERFRAITPITASELNAVDPTFRALARKIAAGEADKRDMRAFEWLRWRIEPYDEAVDLSVGRDEALARLRDKVRSRAAAQAFRARAAESPLASPGEALDGSFGATFGGATDASTESTVVSMGVSATGTWTAIGPTNIPGRTTGLAQPAGQPATLYASTAAGGLWRTTDSGATWTPLTDFEASLSGGAVLLDPNDANTIWFATGEGNFTSTSSGVFGTPMYPGAGVLKSTNGGMTWTISNDFSPNGIRRLALHPSDSTRLYAAGQSGCYLSTDAGATFTLITTGGIPSNGPASDVVVDPNDASRVFCAFYSDGIYRTEDGGTSWTVLDDGISTSPGRVALAIAPSDSNIMLAGIAENSGDLFVSTDAGDSWSRANGGVPLGYCGGQCVWDNAVGFDATNANVMYAGGISTYRSQDGGATWDTIPNVGSGVHVDQHFVLSPTANEVFLANDGGIYRSTDQGESFTQWAGGMDTSQYYAICRHSTDDDWAMGGTQDNGTHRRLNLGWQQVLGGDGGMCMTGPPGSDVVIGEFQGHAMRRSSNGGNSWGDAEDGIGDSEPRPWIGVMAPDPSDRNNMWTTTNDIYRSLDAKATAWVRVGDNVRCDPAAGCLSASSISVAPSDSNTVWIAFRAQGAIPPFTPGTPGGVLRTNNALDATPTWTDVTGATFPLRSIRQIRVHPDTPTTAYVVFTGTGTERIRKTIDDGATWTDVTGDHPAIPINDLMIDADNPGTLLSATDLGVYRSDDDGTTWYGFSDGLPRSPAMFFTYNRSSGKLRVGTHGRSMWDFVPSATSGPVAVPDGEVIPGDPMRADRLSSTEVRVTWDVATCTGTDTNLFHGDLTDVSTLSYNGQVCDLGTTGTADVTLPAGDVFFVVSSEDAGGTEGPHGFDGTGTVRGANGVGFCGVTAQDTNATCP